MNENEPDHDLPTTEGGLLRLQTYDGGTAIVPRAAIIAAHRCPEPISTDSESYTVLHLQTGSYLKVEPPPEAFEPIIEANAEPTLIVSGEDGPQIEELHS